MILHQRLDEMQAIAEKPLLCRVGLHSFTVSPVFDRVDTYLGHELHVVKYCVRCYEYHRVGLAFKYEGE